VQQLDFTDIVHTATLIFQGRVVSVTPVAMGERLIQTHVEFEILDVLKGDYDQARITLKYLGGRIGPRQMQVADMTLPEPGETGFYFVEDPAGDYVHPLVGWAQGHYLVTQAADGREQVTTADAQPVQAIQSRPAEEPAGQNDPQTDPQANSQANQLKLSEGVAAGIVLQQFPLLQQAMTVSEFSQRVRQIHAAGPQQ
ncbi:MAG: hypothetical protein RQ757_13980, partial [Pseudomonadales bacterium]|nr:hypothetical protein [Pseudomonadales bacterium]